MANSLLSSYLVSRALGQEYLARCFHEPRKERRDGIILYYTAGLACSHHSLFHMTATPLIFAWVKRGNSSQRITQSYA